MDGFTRFIADAVIMLPAFLISLSFHEFFHARVATWLGDDTPRKMGRLTLNPLAHVDFLGLFFLVLFKFGWAKPVVFDQRNFKHPRFYSILTALAGPFSNFLLALISFYGLAYLSALHLPMAVEISFFQMLQALAYVNLMLGVFNLLPIPPLDGSHILTAFLMDKFPEFVWWVYQYSIFILLAIFMIPQSRTMLVNLIMFAEKILKLLVV